MFVYIMAFLFSTYLTLPADRLQTTDRDMGVLNQVVFQPSDGKYLPVIKKISRYKDLLWIKELGTLPLRI